MCAHWRKYQDEKEFLYAYDLDGRDVTVTIERVEAGELQGENGRKTKKPVAILKETKKKLALNSTNCRTIAQLYGSNEVNDWAGKRITIYPTTTQMGGETKDCLRIKPVIPPAPSTKSAKSEAA